MAKRHGHPPVPIEDRVTALERLWSRVDTSGDCWLWTGSTDGAYGYGRLRLPNDRTGQPHRLAWELAHGKPVPKGYLVCHRCDTPACCRPSHLFLGTNQENIMDAAQKGRLSGKVHPLVRNRLIAAIVAGELTRTEAARVAGVTPTTVNKWLISRHLTAGKDGRSESLRTRPERKIALERLASGETPAKIARDLGIPRGTVKGWASKFGLTRRPQDSNVGVGEACRPPRR